jgi:hypothetical protein
VTAARLQDALGRSRWPRRLISLQDNRINLFKSAEVPLLVEGASLAEAFGASDDDKERASKHGQGDVAVPGVLFTNLEANSKLG